MKRNRNGLTGRCKLSEQRPGRAIMEYEEYRTVVEKAADFVYVIDKKNRVLSVNKSAATLLGKTPEEIEGKSIFDLFPKKIATAYSQHLREVFKTGKGRLDSDSRMVVGGQEFWVSARLDPITDSQGNVVAVSGVSRDITERKRLEEEIRGLACFPSENPNPVLRLDGRGIVLSSNEASRPLLREWGAELARVAPKPWRDLVTNALSTGQSRNFDIEFGGRSYTFLVKPIMGAGYVNLYGRDITDRKRMEARLAYQANLLANVNDTVIASDENFNITSWNRAAELIYGWKADEILGRKGPEVLRTEFIGIEKSEVFRQLAQTGEWRGELIHHGKDGKPIHMDSASITLRDEGGRITGYVAVNRDITERKQIEESLRQSERRYRGLVEQSLVGIGLSKGNRVVSANPALLQMFGYDNLEEFLKIPLTDHVAPESRELILTRMEKVGVGEQVPQEFEYNILRKDGEVRTLQATSAHVTLDGETHTETVFQDITERKRTEEEQRRSSQFLQSIIENANVWLDALDKEKNVLIWNKAAETISGYCRGEVVGRRKIWEWLYPDEEYRKQITDSITDVLQHGRVDANVETKIRRKDGESRIISWNERALTGSDGKVMGTIAIGHDITELREIRDELERYSKHLQKSEGKLRALHQHALQLSSASNIEEIVKSTLDAIEFALGFDVADVYLAAGDSVSMRGTRGAPIGLSEEHINGRGLVAKAARTRTTVRVSDTTKEPDYVDRKGCDWTGPHTMLSELVVPVVVQAETIAVLNAESIHLDAFSSEDQRLLETLAAHVGSEMQRLKHAQELETYSKHLEELVEERTKRLLQSEKRFRELADLLPQMVFEIDDKGYFTLVNRSGLVESGYTEEEIQQGLNAIQVFAEEDRDRVRENIKRILAGQDLGGTEYTARRRDGSTFPVIVHSTRILKEGKPVGLRGIAIDITERKRSEEELRSTRDQLEHVLATNPAVLYFEKPLPDFSDTVSTFVSESAKFVLGFEPKNFLGESGLSFWRSRIQPDDLARYWAELPSLWKNGHHTFEYRFLHSDGTYRWITEQYRVIRDAEGRISQAVAVAIDATERKQLEEKLAKAERFAIIGETAAMVGHDLRNPLQGIAGAVYLLKQEALTAKEKDEMLQLIEGNVGYADAIVRDLSEYSAEIKLKLIDTTPKSIVRETLGKINVPRTVTVHDRSEERPTIKVDSDRMRRAFISLVENAIEAMPQGGTLTITSKLADGNVEISFSDTGSGMPERVMQNLWKPLQTTKAKGLGLGLAICKRIVDAHGGNISVKSKAGEGTTVTIRLPVKSEAVEVMRK